MKSYLLVLCFASAFSAFAHNPGDPAPLPDSIPFSPQGTYYTTNYEAIVADFDQDGDADGYLFSGFSNQIRNDNYTFSGLIPPTPAWPPHIISCGDGADFDRDGDIDVLQTGEDQLADSYTFVLTNEAGVLTGQNISNLIPGVDRGQIEWVDFDRDGDYDIFIAGQQGASNVAALYEKKSGAYILTPHEFHQFTNPVADFFDLENDGDPDLALLGYDFGLGYSRLIVYRNISNLFFPVDTTILDGGSGDLESGDLDDDGDLDLVVAYRLDVDPSSGFVLNVYLNDGSGAFTLVQEYTETVPVFNQFFSKIYLLDLDNDGQREILLGGQERVFVYNGSNYVPLNLDIQNETTSLGVGGFDADHKIDLWARQSLSDVWTDQRFQAYQNVSTNPSQPPAPPTDIAVDINLSTLTFSWDAGSDDHTPAAALGYNIRVGTTPGNADVVSCNSTATGQRMQWDGGNVPSGTSFKLHNLAPGDYYVSVQSIDAHFLGSAFLTRPFTVPATLAAPDLLSPAFGSQDVWIRPLFSWTAVPNAEQYYLQVSEDPAFGEIAAEQITFGATSDSLTLPNCQTTYYWRVQSQAAGYLGAWSGVFPLTTRPVYSIVDTLVLPPNDWVARLKFLDLDQDFDADLAAVVLHAQNPFDVYASAYFFKNNGGAFAYAGKTDSTYFSDNLNFTPPKMSWVDRDGDGDYDLLLNGFALANTRYYRNDNGIFSPQPAGDFPAGGQPAWFDANNDNRPDLLLPYSCGTTLYLNQSTDGSLFQEIDLGLTNCSDASLDPLDYDNDGGQDIMVSGSQWYVARLHNAGNGSFVPDDAAMIIPVDYGDTEVADVDADGDPDLLLCGETQMSTWVNHLYYNDGGEFAAPVSLPGDPTWEAAFADYDVDGDLDPLLGPFSFGETHILRNRNGDFDVFFSLLPNVSWYPPAADFNDYDNDGDPDVAYAISTNQIFLHRNNEGTNVYTQPQPSAPPDLQGETLSDNDVTLTFQPPSGPESEGFQISPATTYNLAVGTAPGLTNVVSPLARLSSGQPLLPAPGNIGARHSYTLKNLPNGTYYWTVQAVSPGLTHSPFAPPQSFTVDVTATGLPISSVSRFSVYPNPADGQFWVRHQGESPGFAVSLFDPTGKLLYRTGFQTANPVSISCDHLPAGVYMLRLVSDEGMETVMVAVKGI